MKGVLRNVGFGIRSCGSDGAAGGVPVPARYQIADVRRPWETWKRIAIVSLCANAFLVGIVMAAIHSRL